MTNRALKDSGVEWIGDIPQEWQIMKFKYVMKKDKTIANKYNNEDVISLTKSGVIIRDLENPTGKMPASFDGYQYVQEGNLLLCLFDIDVTPRCIGIVKNDGVTSPAYSRYKLMNGFDINYYNYLLTYLDDEKILLSYTKSLRNTLTDEYFGAVSTIKPTLEEQQKIATFLDEKVAHIDNILEDTKSSIKNLKSYKKSLVTTTVIKGLDPDVKMKDSGIDWVGMIPTHWETNTAKRIFKKEQRDIEDDEIVTCFRDGEVTLRKNRRTVGFTISTKEIGYQGIRIGDLIIHQMDAFAGAIGVSDSNGKSTPVYIVCTSDKNSNNYYYAYLLRAYAEVGYIESMARGIRERSTDFRYATFSITPLLVPPIDEQETIVLFLENILKNIDNLISQKEFLIKELESYKKSMIFEYVTGKKEVI